MLGPMAGAIPRITTFDVLVMTIPYNLSVKKIMPWPPHALVTNIFRLNLSALASASATYTFVLF